MALRVWASSAANALRLSSAPPPFPLSRCFSTGTPPPLKQLLTIAISIHFNKYNCAFICMDAVLDGLKYATSHEWVKHEGSVATIGITEHAQVIISIFHMCSRLLSMLFYLLPSLN